MSRSSIIALAVFAVLVALVLTMRTNAAQKLQATALTLVRPIHTTTSAASSRVEAFGRGLQTLQNLENENQQLREDNEKLRATNQMMNDLAAKNDTLNQALDFKKRSSFNLLAAHIITRSSTTWWSTVQIDRGEQDGLDSDMPVVTDLGLVGKTTTVAANTASVLLITDENCKVFAYVEGAADLPVESRDHGIVGGERTSANGQPELSLNFLPKTAQIQPGQKVFSFGVAGGVFPRGLLLGTVKATQVRALDQRATVTPAVDISRLENVFIVRGMRGVAGSPAASPGPSVTSGREHKDR